MTGALLPPLPPPSWTVTVEVRGRFHCPTCDKTLPGSVMDHVKEKDAEYAFGHVYPTTGYKALHHMKTCKGNPMPTVKTSITTSEIDTHLSNLARISSDLHDMLNELPACPAWDAVQTAGQVVENAGQALHTMKLDRGHITVVNS